ncbi:MAG: cysteine dioxygenase family protein [Nocardioidaceae bacterium]|nr:cysteine dioxygenase family protein [Nocardioidaceae bacterium]
MSTDIAFPLLEVVRDQAADPALLDLLDPAPEDRIRLRLVTTPEYELWLIAWPPGAATEWHDHGASAGALTVLRGTLTEHAFPGCLHLEELGPGDVRAFRPGYAHDVRNASGEPALSLHAYSPALATTTRFTFRGDRLEPLGVEAAGPIAR